MKDDKEKPAPLILKYGLHEASDEFRALRQLLFSEWKLVLLLLAGILAIFAYSEPLPPRDVYLAVGQAGSEFENLGKKFVPYFTEQGVRLHLVNTKGSDDSLRDVGEGKLNVNAALMVGGMAKPGAYPNLYSLGSVEYVPLWLFYRGDVAPNTRAYEYFSQKRIAVGQPGSATEIILRDVLRNSGIKLEERDNVLRISHHEAVQRLLDGEIDALCLMDGIESPNVQSLLKNPDIKIYDFPFAPAYVKKLRYLDVVTIPQGAFDIKAVRPPTDIRMLASTITIIVEKKMHPAIQQLFVYAADEVSSNIDQFFAKPEFFPTYIDHSLPLSPIAKRYFEQGAPALRDKLPFWLLSLFDRIWLLLVGVAAVIYPIFRLFPSYRRVHSLVFINNAYQRIKAVENASVAATTRAEVQALIDELDDLERQAFSTLITSDMISSLYTMRGTLRNQRSELIEKMTSLPA